MKMTFARIFFGGLVVFVLMVGMVVFMPDMMWKSTPSINAREYSALQAKGRHVFLVNGCNNCHTQYVRESDNAMGEISQPGDFVFDQPPLLGSERTGPDLTHIGRKRSEAWEIDHLKDPRRFSPMSIMPRFEFLPEDELTAVASYLYALGDKVTQQRMVPSPSEYARTSDPQGVRMVATSDSGSVGWSTWNAAGLQRGKDIYVQNCLTCHGCAGNGLGSYAGTLIVTPANYKQEPFRSMPEDQFFWHVSEGVQGTVMPPWKEALSEADRWMVIRYIRMIFSRPVMRDPDEGDPPTGYAEKINPLPLNQDVLDHGKAIFTRECMVCHGVAGRGEGPYGDGLQPTPPDFGDGSYGTRDKPIYTDADYFWRISEGVPWTAMPTWKLQYDEKDRWALVHYVRALLTLTEAEQEVPDPEFFYPDTYKTQQFPQTVNYERGKAVYAEHCAHCHGLALDGQGWDGTALKPEPADFWAMLEEGMEPDWQGSHLARVTFGIHNSAMPVWGEYLPLDQRWDVVKFIMDSIMIGRPVTKSVLPEGQMAAEFMLASREMWVDDAGGVISGKRGAEVYATYCATCHGDTGQGDGPGTQKAMSKWSAAFPEKMTDGYVYWRISQGVPESVMPGFTVLLDDADLWNVTAWVVDGNYRKK